MVWSATGEAYSGPVSGLNDQYVTLTHDNLNITSDENNVFIHTGSGDDAIQMAHGDNVLDGGTGSNFLVGGDGHDQFFVDDRNPSADIWSTIAHFAKGDQAVIWGLTPSDHLIWQDNQGAAGFQGLTAHVKNGPNTISLSLAGYSQDNLTSGQFLISYGHTLPTNGLAGSDYMIVRYL